MNSDSVRAPRRTGRGPVPPAAVVCGRARMCAAESETREPQVSGRPLTRHDTGCPVSLSRLVTTGLKRKGKAVRLRLRLVIYRCTFCTSILFVCCGRALTAEPDR
eukprot:5020958-Prymnesium_polylepis.1